jgi:hypothetical protein
LAKGRFEVAKNLVLGLDPGTGSTFSHTALLFRYQF